jgi:N-acetylneuraminate synthase
MGSSDFVRPKAEAESVIFRRSLYFVSDVKAGSVIKPSDVRRIRPGFGLPPKFYEEILGKKVTRDVTRGQAVTWDLIKKDAS